MFVSDHMCSLFDLVVACLQMEKFIKARLEVIRWVGLAVLIIQIFSIFIAYLLSSAQAANLEDFRYFLVVSLTSTGDKIVFSL